MKKKLCILNMVAVMMAALCGCGQQGGNRETETAQESTVQEGAGETAADSAGSEGAENGFTETDVPAEPNTEPAYEEPEPEPVLEGKVVVDIPDGFYEYLSPSGIYVTKKYPDDGSNIYIVTAPYYGTLPEESEYTKKINENLTAQAGAVVRIKMEEYEKTTVDGFEAARAVYTYSYDNMNFKRTEYTVNTDITTTIAYTQVNGADWNDAFAESILSMRVE